MDLASLFKLRVPGKMHHGARKGRVSDWFGRLVAWSINPILYRPPLLHSVKRDM